MKNASRNTVHTPHYTRASSATLEHHDPRVDWRSLRLFSVYRLLAIVLLFVLHSTGIGIEHLSPEITLWFLLTIKLYFLAGIGLMLLSLFNMPAFRLQVYWQTSIDILMIAMVAFTGGGVESGLGTLAIPAVAGLSLLLQGRMALLLAALMFFALTLSEILRTLTDLQDDPAFTQMGLLGAGLFATALLALTLARRTQEREVVIKRQGIDLANMTQLNAYIVESLQSGVIAVNNAGYPYLINAAAWQLLGSQAHSINSLQHLSPALYAALSAWQRTHSTQAVQLLGDEKTPELRVRFVPLGDNATTGVLIFLEDTAEMRRQMQAAKLASVGRLTASIAHEIRNPLGAISHAAQLLAEADTLTAPEQRLVKIIRDHSRRMNTIIQDVLCMSRRNNIKHESISIETWLQDFVQEFRSHQGLLPEQIKVHVTPKETKVVFDPQQLHQILWNLCLNAVKYGKRPDQPVCIELIAGAHRISQQTILDVTDTGYGIPADLKHKIFEPFVTTAQQGTGTGLGLYIARELCESNGGTLEYIHRLEGGGCFRIYFPFSTGF